MRTSPETSCYPSEMHTNVRSPSSEERLYYLNFRKPGASETESVLASMFELPGCKVQRGNRASKRTSKAGCVGDGICTCIDV